MAPQEVHESLVIGVGHIKELDDLPVATVGLNQATADDGLDLSLGDQTVGIGPGDRFPEIVHDDCFGRFPNQGIGGQRDRIRCNYFCLRHVVAAFNDVLQFANVSRVMIGKQLFHGIGRQSSLFSTVGIQRCDDMTHQKRDIGPTFSKRGNFNRKYVETVEKVFAEITLTRHRPKVTVGGGDYAGVDRAVDNVTESTHLLLLKHAEKLHLESFGSIRNFIQEERSLVRLLK